MYTLKINADSSVIIIKDSKSNTKKKAASIMERIKTYEDACDELGVEPIEYIQVYRGGLTERDIKAQLAFAQIIIIARALNEGWEPDWANSNQYKYYPWLEYKAGFGFSDSDFGDSYTGTGVGSRLCLKSRELAEYAGKQFNKEYNEFFTL